MTNTPQIRLASMDDAAALADAGTRLFLQAYDGLIPAPEMAAYIAQHFHETRQQSELSNPAMTTLLLVCSNKIAGFAQLCHDPVPIKGFQAEVELRRIYLDKEWHGRGMARALMKKVVDVADSLSAQAIWLAVWDANIRAIAFYRKVGFKVIGAQEFRVDTLVQNDLVMQAGLDALE